MSKKQALLLRVGLLLLFIAAMIAIVALAINSGDKGVPSAPGPLNNTSQTPSENTEV